MHGSACGRVLTDYVKPLAVRLVPATRYCCCAGGFTSSMDLLWCGVCNETASQGDAVVIGAGGAGMRAALQFPKSGQTCALLSSLRPVPRHRFAQGGITVALGNTHEDNWNGTHVRHR